MYTVCHRHFSSFLTQFKGTFLWIQIRIQEGKKQPFEVLDFLFGGLEASPVAWTSLMETLYENY
jgi:hypothetical protein